MNERQAYLILMMSHFHESHLPITPGIAPELDEHVGVKEEHGE